jgi:hypothetical protein
MASINVTEKEAENRLAMVGDLLYSHLEYSNESELDTLRMVNRATEGRCTQCGKPVSSVHELKPGTGQCTECAS